MRAASRHDRVNPANHPHQQPRCQLQELTDGLPALDTSGAIAIMCTLAIAHHGARPEGLRARRTARRFELRTVGIRGCGISALLAVDCGSDASLHLTVPCVFSLSGKAAGAVSDLFSCQMGEIVLVMSVPASALLDDGGTWPEAGHVPTAARSGV